MKRLYLFVLVISFIACTACGNNLVSRTNSDGKITGNVEKGSTFKLLIQKSIAYNDGSSEKNVYQFINVDNTTNIKDGEAAFKDFISKYKFDEFIQLSQDGKKVLQKKISGNNTIEYLEIYDEKCRKVFNLDIDFSKYFMYKFSPLLNYYILLADNGEATIYNILGSKKGNIQIDDYQNIVFSDDESKIGFRSYDDGSGENSIYIYNVSNGLLLNKIKIEGNRNNTYITQILKSGKIIYMYKNESFIINYDGTNKKLLGDNIFFPIMSPDERYLAYVKADVNDLSGYIDLDEESVCVSNERGLYIKELANDKTEFLQFNDTENEIPKPLLWVSNL